MFGSAYGFGWLIPTAFAIGAGFAANVTWDEKLDTLVDFTCELVTNRGKVGPEMIGRFYQAGYTDACLVDLVMLVGMTTITNYLNNATWIPVDFPEAPVIICKCDCKK